MKIKNGHGENLPRQTVTKPHLPDKVIQFSPELHPCWPTSYNDNVKKSSSLLFGDARMQCQLEVIEDAVSYSAGILYLLLTKIDATS